MDQHNNLIESSLERKERKELRIKLSRYSQNTGLINPLNLKQFNELDSGYTCNHENRSR